MPVARVDDPRRGMVGSVAGRARRTDRKWVVMDRKWWTLIAVCTGTFMLLLDITVVNVALPDIQKSLHSSFADLQWVVDAYALTLAAFLLTAGVVGDMFGRRRVYAVGMVIFSLSSLACGLSTTPQMLNLSRVVQGVGAAVIFATSLALIAQAFAGRERGTAFGIYGAVLGGALAIGPLLGGVIASGIGWRWIFYLNLPLGVFAIAVCLAKVQESRDPTPRRIDWIGFITFSLSLFMLVYALVQGNARGWHSPTIVGLLVGSAFLMVVFLLAEWLQHDPMLDLTLFKRPAMAGVCLAAFTFSASIFAMFLYLTLYLQEVLGYGPFAAGLRFLPVTVLAFVVAPVAGKLTVRVHVAVPLRPRAVLRGPRVRVDDRRPRRLHLDGAPPRLHPGRHRHRHHQSRPGLGHGLRRPARAERHGHRDIEHLPAGRPGHRYRRPRCGVPESDPPQHGIRARRHARGPERPRQRRRPTEHRLHRGWDPQTRPPRSGPPGPGTP